MNRLLATIMISCFVHTSSFAQSAEDYSHEFETLKNSLLDASASNRKGSAKEIKEKAKQLDEFLSHIYIGRSEGELHNVLPFLCCRYEHTPMTMSAIINHEEMADTIQFVDGRWYITKDLSPDMDVDLLCFDNKLLGSNKQAIKTANSLKKKYTYPLGEELMGKKGSLFYVKDENLYYAAIESKKIPTFLILSNSEIINYASCLKAILKASRIESTYDEIITKYLNTTIDEHDVPIKSISKMIAGREVITTSIPQHSINASDIVNELVRERFMIAIGKDGKVGLLTAIALTGETDYQPVHVRLRMPSLAESDTRVQMSWKDFSNRTVALVKVDIY